jgi:hypothetical protein
MSPHGPNMCDGPIKPNSYLYIVPLWKASYLVHIYKLELNFTLYKA